MSFVLSLFEKKGDFLRVSLLFYCSNNGFFGMMSSSFLKKRGKKMNKTELIAKVAETAELTKKDAGQVVDAVFEAITGALKGGEKVQLMGFGTFEVRERAARKGRNPQSGEEIEIPASKLPAFKAGKELKEAVK
ncbi:hypothetical protein J5TS2_30780 [Brevibacillus halotolerans]|nr:hypothetical protein J5TS2_30780 [Brevibacillus halotolerans]